MREEDNRVESVGGWKTERKKNSKEGACEEKLKREEPQGKEEGRSRSFVTFWVYSNEALLLFHSSVGGYCTSRSNRNFPYIFTCKDASFLYFFCLPWMFDGIPVCSSCFSFVLIVTDSCIYLLWLTLMFFL